MPARAACSGCAWLSTAPPARLPLQVHLCPPRPSYRTRLRPRETGPRERNCSVSMRWEGLLKCHSSENEPHTPTPSFPRRACPVLDTGREPIPGHGSRRGGFETRPPRCGVKKPATHHRRSRANGNPSPAPTRRWYENRGKTPTSVIPAHAGFLLRRNRPPSSPRTLLAAAIFIFHGAGGNRHGQLL